MQETPLQAFQHYASSIGWTAVVGFLCTATWGVFKVGVAVAGFLSDVKTEWESTRATITASKQLLDTVTTNHLAHIQDSSERTARILENQEDALLKMADAVNKNTVAVVELKAFLEAAALYGPRSKEK
jgi:hypothetical protein